MSSEAISTHGGHCLAVTADEPIKSHALSPGLRAALESVEHSIEHLNAALRQAVDAGATVEMRRRARVHSDDGCWADQMAPLVVTK